MKMCNDNMTGNFEGIEKRIVIQLRKNFFEKQRITSLLDINSDTWSKKLKLINCSIISKIDENVNLEKHQQCRAYLLSESSLFIYDDKLFIKTCGKTRVLFFIPILANMLINICENNNKNSEDNYVYDEHFIKRKDMYSLINFIEKNFEYTMFTHMNYMNCIDEMNKVFLQDYPHRSLEEETEFFAYFFKSMKFINTQLPQNKNHYIFYARLNRSFSYIDVKFCSEFISFSINNDMKKKCFHSLYLNTDSLQLLQRKGEYVKLYGANDDVIDGSDLEDDENFFLDIERSECDSFFVKNIEDTSEKFLLMEENLDCNEMKNTNKKKIDKLPELQKTPTDLLEITHNGYQTFLRDSEEFVKMAEPEPVSVKDETTVASSRNLSVTSMHQEKGTYAHLEKGYSSEITKECACDFSCVDEPVKCENKHKDAQILNTNNFVLNESNVLIKNQLENNENETAAMLYDLLSEDEKKKKEMIEEIGKQQKTINKNKHGLNSLNYYHLEDKSFDDDTFITREINTFSNTHFKYAEENENDGKRDGAFLYECKNKNKNSFLYNEFYFVPCGFSCNAINETNFFCVHYSPEDAISYVSIEFSVDFNIEMFVPFMRNQMQYYHGKYLYVINYLNSNTPSEDNSNYSEIQKTNAFQNDTSESYYLKNIMKRNILVRNDTYYELISFKEEHVDFMHVKYFCYELKCINKGEKAKAHASCTNHIVKSEKVIDGSEAQRQFEKLMYNTAFKFCKKRKIVCVDVDTCDDGMGFFQTSQLEIKDSCNVNDTSLQIEKEQITMNRDVTTKETLSGISYNEEEILASTKHINQPKTVAQPFEKNFIDMYMLQKVLNEDLETSILCINLGKILSQYVRFKKNFPNVTPFYSMKSNNDKIVIMFLYEMGCNFDCASIGEIKKLTSFIPNIPRDRIVFANTIKSINSLKYAKQEKINLCTFDNLEELKKIARWYPKCNLILRINVDFGNCKSYMSSKYGASKNEWKKLYKYAKLKNLNIKGISFHVGSNNKNLMYYCKAIKFAREAWDMADFYGFQLEILNVGGGFPEELGDELKWCRLKHEQETMRRNNNENEPLNKPSQLKLCMWSMEKIKILIQGILNGENGYKTENMRYPFEHMALAIKMSISHYFKELEHKIKIICEPGRYFASGSALLAVKVIGKRYLLQDNVDYINSQFDEAKETCKNTSKSMNMYISLDGINESVTKICDSANKIKEKASTDPDNGNAETGVNKVIMENITSLNIENVKLNKITDIKKKIVDTNNSSQIYYAYYVNDSIYGCFSSIIFDEYNRTPSYVIRNKKNVNYSNNSFYLTTIFGQTCDGLDMINSGVYLPECNINDWLVYDYIGAYSFVSSSQFNGFEQYRKFYIFPERRWVGFD